MDKTMAEIKEQTAPEEAGVQTGARKAARKDEKKKTAALEARIAEAEAANAALQAAVAKEKDDYVRLLAEFDNFRRRNAQEKLDIVKSASEDTIKGLLPILDDFERAIAALEKTEDAESAKEGTSLIYSKLVSYLRSKGLAAIESDGAAFDTDFHEAVAQFPVPEEDRKGHVIDTAQKGYTLNGKVIRFAKVVVGI